MNTFPSTECRGGPVEVTYNQPHGVTAPAPAELKVTMKTKNVKRANGPIPEPTTKPTPKKNQSVQLTTEEVIRLKLLAKEAGLSVSRYVEKLIEFNTMPTNNDDPIVNLVISPNHPGGRWGVWTDDAGRYYILDVRIPLEEQNPPPVNLVTALQIAASAMDSGCFDTRELPAMLRDASRALAAGGAR